jgi:hypothetical protein
VPPRTPPELSSATSGSIPSFRDAAGVSPSSPMYSDEYISPTNGYSSPPNGCANQSALPVCFSTACPVQHKHQACDKTFVDMPLPAPALRHLSPALSSGCCSAELSCSQVVVTSGS